MSAGFGVDIWCTDSLFTARYARGPRVVLQALYRRLITPRGMLRGGDEESAYGLDIAAYVGAVGYPTTIASIPGVVRAELLKDDRVSGIDVDVEKMEASDGTISLLLTVHVTLEDEASEYTLTLSVTDISVTLLGGI